MIVHFEKKDQHGEIFSYDVASSWIRPLSSEKANPYQIEFKAVDANGGKFYLKYKGKVLEGYYQIDSQNQILTMAANGYHACFAIVSSSTLQEAKAKGNQILAPLPGKIIRVLKQAGDFVEEGETVFVLDAMKMEHSLKAPRSGVLQEVHATEGVQTDAGMILAVLREES
ncbi:MAG: acetyl-CoA carboxylase biotin carboxyl carrier protein subunit [Candidatus Hydrogenedentota bacterium]|nr:MAG: acetyl-CoA carboxylase biotin carboxyl carrier protein subunit [Candidatus Hydrogenedentota bacterium]